MIRIQEVTRAEYLEADEQGQIAAMPEVHYYGTRMFVADAPAGTARTDIGNAVMRFADPKAFAKNADKRKG